MVTSAALVGLALASPQPTGKQAKPSGLPPRLSDYITRHASTPGSSVIVDAKK